MKEDCVLSHKPEQGFRWRENRGDDRRDQRIDRRQYRCEKGFEFHPLDLFSLICLSASYLFVYWIAGGTRERWTCICIYRRSFLLTVWVELHPAWIIQRWKSSLMFHGHILSLAQLDIPLGFLATCPPAPSSHGHLNSVFFVIDVTISTVLALVNQ